MIIVTARKPATHHTTTIQKGISFSKKNKTSIWKRNDLCPKLQSYHGCSAGYSRNGFENGWNQR